jgi:hypothetical protein
LLRSCCPSGTKAIRPSEASLSNIQAPHLQQPPEHENDDEKDFFCEDGPQFFALRQSAA